MDGTGPTGRGSGTGRGFGRCGKKQTNEDSAGRGRGLGKRSKSGGETGKGKHNQRGSQK